MQIYINKNGQQFGPYTVEQLQQYVQQGHFTPQDFACYDGQNWVTVGQVPGLAAGSPTAAAQPQTQQVAQQQQQAQAVAQQQQAATAVVVDAAAKKKKIILLSSIGGAAALLVAVLLIWSPWSGGDDEEQVAEEGAASKTSSPEPSPSNPEPSPSSPDTTPSGPDPEPTDPDIVIPGHAALQLVPLIERIPANAVGVLTLDLSKIHQKGGTKAESLLPTEAPPPFRDFLNDPSSIGLDLSEPVRLFLPPHPTQPDDDDPSIGFAAKLEDSAKLKQFLQSVLSPSGEWSKDRTESRDGYDIWAIDPTEAYLAIAKDFFCFVANDSAGPQHLTKELERFMTSDGSNSLVEAHPEYELQGRKGYDVGLWLDLEKFGSMAGEEIPPEFLGLVEAVTLSGGLRFDNGEATLEINGASKGLAKALGGGGVPSSLTKYLAADAPLLGSISVNLENLIGSMSDTLESEADLDLDETNEMLGVAPREVLDIFQGGFAFSLTGLPSMGGGAPMRDIDSTEPVRNGFNPGQPEPDIGNFGDGGSAGPPPNPFADGPAGGGSPKAPSIKPQKVLTGPSGKAYPIHWGAPPLRQTRDLRPLPGGYGRGSGTLARWIQENLDKDTATGKGSGTRPTVNPPQGVGSTEVDPFGGSTSPGTPEIAVDPPFGGGGPPSGGFNEGPPPGGFNGGPPPGGFGGGPPSGGGPAGGMPDFVVAASIDQAKWDALMQKAPNLAQMIIAAQAFGIVAKAENGVLSVGTLKHVSIVGSGFPNAVRGPAKNTFTSHDLALQVTSKSLVKSLMDGGMPPAFVQALGSLDSLVVTGDSTAGKGSLSLKLVFNDKRKNSLPALIDLGPRLLNVMSSGQGNALPGESGDHAAEGDGDEKVERDPF